MKNIVQLPKPYDCLDVDTVFVIENAIVKQKRAQL